MTVSSNDRRKSYAGNGVTTIFNGPMAYSADVISISLSDDVTGDITSAGPFTVTQLGKEAGTIVTLSVAPPTGKTLTILRTVPYAQTVDVTNQGAFNARVIETGFDLPVMQIQQIADRQNRSLYVADNVPGDISLVIDGIDPLKPLVGAADGRGFEFGDTELTGDMLLRGELAKAEEGKGSDLTAFPELLASTAPGYLKTISDIINGEQVSVHRALPRSQLLAIRAGTSSYDTTADVNELLLAMIDMGRRGGRLFYPQGKYTQAGTVLLDRSADSALGRLSICGEHESASFINYTGSGAAIRIKNADSVGDEGNASYNVIENMLIGGNGKQAGSIGIAVDIASFLDLRNLNIGGFDYGLDCIDVDQSYFERLKLRFNNKGMRFRKNPTPVVVSTQPNNLTFMSCNIASNTDYGGLFEGGSCIHFVTGAIENNGTVGPAGYGLKFKDCGYEGGLGADISGVYFESNNGVADLILEGIAAGGLTQIAHNVRASFNRASATNIATNNILCTFGEPAIYSLQRLNVASTFKSLGAYTPSALRPYIAFNGVPASKDNFLDIGSLYEDAIERPTFVQTLVKRYVKLSKAANQTLTAGVAATFAVDTIPSAFSWTPGIAAGVVTIDEAGFYSIGAFVVFSSAAAGTKKVLFYKNGTLIGYGEGGQDAVTCNTSERFEAGDTLTVQVSQATGGGLDIVASLSKVTIIKDFD